MTVIENLAIAIRDSAKYNPDVQVAPMCILWPDKEKQWEAIIPRLQNIMPELLVLGAYQDEKKTGPAIWLRCAVSRTVDLGIPLEFIPIIYLPGISRQDIMAVESCPEKLKPLASLQYIGYIWSQTNTKDWTLIAWLKSEEGGLDLSVDQSNATKSALQIAFNALLDEKKDLLRNHHLDAAYFNTLLTGGDPVRDLLAWLDHDTVFKSEKSGAEWKAFNDVSQTNFLFTPEKGGVLAAAELLAVHNGSWKSVWERFCEAPQRYPHIPDLIRKCKKSEFDLFADEHTLTGWPQWNDAEEALLRQALLDIEKFPEHEARKHILKLHKKHIGRCTLVWAALGYSPYAKLLEPLAVIAELTANSLAGGTEKDIAEGYRTFGWQIDDAIISALSICENNEVFEAASSVIRTLYYPWAESCALRLQAVWDLNDPSKQMHFPSATDPCILFVDGLRYDCAKRLVKVLLERGFRVQETSGWTPLPSVTGTGKPAVAPFTIQPDCVSEEVVGYNFEILNTNNLRKIIKDNGYTILLNDGSPVPPAETTHKLWVECGDIDHEGHSRGWKLARQINDILNDLADMVSSLYEQGWNNIRIVTDHGWLLLPGGLNKIDLPAALADTKWGRSAALKSGAECNERLFPWYWNPNQHFALANGIDCFKAGEEYTHGGLSVQESLVLSLTVSKALAQSTKYFVNITDISWKGLRCAIQVDGNCEGIKVDIRMAAGQPESSVVLTPRPFKAEGTASLAVENDSIEGKTAFVVCIGPNGDLVAQKETIIGGGV